MKRLSLFAMPRRLVLPFCEHTIHLAREASFRRLDDAYSRGREVFLATIDRRGELSPIGVVARIVTFGRIPARRGEEGTEDRSLLRGLYRARIPAGLRSDAREADIEPLPEIAGESPSAVERTTFESTLLRARLRHRASLRRAEEIDALGESISRLYRLAAEEQVRSHVRQTLLETDGLRRKMDVLRAAFEDEEDAVDLEARILART